MIFTRKKTVDPEIVTRVARMLRDTYDMDDDATEHLDRWLTKRAKSSDEGEWNEFILDNPISARFRLKMYDGKPHVSYYPVVPPGSSREELGARTITAQIQYVWEGN